ncbi:hypothetical protein PsYK624_043910 [Phanerochaete sordida]|uniref:Uncharacterized protein n=1 Tax=Phanerochaete sordida TaxID=48140 RepID=A0A9P3G3A8_9APHY|nr:hypothetical protein PsYK624_043910 [Phanerochaete sordida]
MRRSTAIADTTLQSKNASRSGRRRMRVPRPLLRIWLRHKQASSHPGLRLSGEKTPRRMVPRPLGARRRR